jgi:phenylpyruvate tautomerase PptA (4-oxalocrotonate tautomerase family)
MAFPDPKPGLVISYGYLWHREYRKGLEEGRKARPCVIVISAVIASDGETIVRVAPITHSQPDDPSLALEISAAVKRHLGLDDERSWIILDEFNEFIWPGFDLQPVSGSPGRIAYGFLPPALFNRMLTVVRNLWRSGRGKSTRRD